MTGPLRLSSLPIRNAMVTARMPEIIVNHHYPD